jgi:hypothetical protein
VNVSVLAELEDLGRRIGADVERFVREGEQELKQHFVEHPQPLFALLRKLKPVLVIHDIAIVTRYADVLAVLGDGDAFGVEPYGVKMRALAGEFILGLDDSLPSTLPADASMILLEELVDALGPHLVSTADRISARLGYRRDDDQAP